MSVRIHCCVAEFALRVPRPAVVPRHNRYRGEAEALHLQQVSNRLLGDGAVLKDLAENLPTVASRRLKSELLASQTRKFQSHLACCFPTCMRTCLSTIGVTIDAGQAPRVSPFTPGCAESRPCRPKQHSFAAGIDAVRCQFAVFPPSLLLSCAH
eukprot:12221-Rhodomonas_salina.2